MTRNNVRYDRYRKSKAFRPSAVNEVVSEMRFEAHLAKLAAAKEWERTHRQRNIVKEQSVC